MIYFVGWKMKILIRHDENLFYLRSPFHIKLKDIFNGVKGYSYDYDQQIHSFPLEEKEKMIELLLSMDITIKEVKEFEKILPTPKIAAYKISNDTIEIHATYSKEVKKNNLSYLITLQLTNLYYLRLLRYLVVITGSLMV